MMSVFVYFVSAMCDCLTNSFVYTRALLEDPNANIEGDATIMCLYCIDHRKPYCVAYGQALNLFSWPD